MQDALSGTYTIVRELGGGGMSRVFLADDIALHRAVVIKVLHPELAAGVNAERFKREVLLSARLQHPHIVPVLTAGEVAGLPYYVMPFVKGDTLRARLESGPLSISDTIDIIGDVAKALAYAHEEGVVHRDIKPDNILLSHGAATVADFGIAKALSSARQQTSDGALTTLGMSLGTPAYMAPEQVAGDPDTDHRADIYSLGGVMYEMLAGKAPFAGKSPQQLLAAQVMEQPVPVTQHRPDTPRALASLVMRCLEKEPAKRPQSASELAAPMETGETPAPIGRATLRSRGTTWIAAGVTTIAIAAALFASKRMGKPTVSNGTINLAIAPFEVLDPQLTLWKEGIVDVLSRNLDGAGPIRALSPGATIKQWGGHAERAAAVAFGKKVGAQIVFYGQLQSAGKDLVNAKLWIVDTEKDSPPVEIEVRDSVSRMDRVADSLSFRSLAAIGRLRTIGAAKLASLGSNSLPAVRAFLHGAQYFRRSQWDSAAMSLREAVSIDSTFGIAYAMLGEAYGWTGGDDVDRQWQAFTKAGEQLRAGLSPHDSLTLVSVRHFAIANKRGPNRYSEMRAAYAAAAEVTSRYPDDAAAWYLLADMRFHNDRTISEREALGLFDNAIRADSDFAPAYIHAIELAYRNGAQIGRRYATAFLARSQPGLQQSALTLAIRMGDGELTGASLRAILDTINPSFAGNALAALRRNPDSSEVIADVLRAAVKRIPAPRNAQFKYLLADELAFRGHISEAWQFAVENHSYSAAEIAALGLVPADSAAAIMSSWLKLQNDASLFMLPALGAARDTVTLAKLKAGAEARLKGDTSSQRRAVLSYFIAAANAYGVLARGDSAAATPLFDAFSDSVISLGVEQFIRARLVARKEPARALALLERMTSTSDLLYVARQLERGRIAEKLGERERAVDAYAYVVAAWRNTESPLLRNAVDESKSALSRLDSDGKMRANLQSR
ncbi:MAG: protein kinase [Gemmatimonadota bacterium]